MPAPLSDQLTILQSRRGLAALDPIGLWRNRGLCAVLAWRDFQIRYKQSLLGIAWAAVQPLAMVLILALVLGKLLGLEHQVEGSYALFVCAGMVPWMLFAAVVTAAANSLVANAEVLKKVYFPRLIVPLSAAGAPLADFAVAMVVLLGVMVWSGSPFTVHLLWLPVLGAAVMLSAIAMGVWLSAITVTYRDARLIVPFMLQLWFFATPVIYPLPVSPRWTWLLALNPMDGPIRGFRAAINGQSIDLPALLISIVIASFILMLGLAQFTRTERRFADVV